MMAKTRQPNGTKPAVAGRDDLCCSSLTEAPLNEDEAAELGRVFGALSDPVRLRLLSLVASQVEVCSCDLEAPLGRSQPTVSHHTRVLAEAGLIVGEKRGRWMWWRADPDRLAIVRKALGG
jgi:ArsR family transcriptional regulator, arsenate/arsenite/antimonite-responsive transcriptional repressor